MNRRVMYVHGHSSMSQRVLFLGPRLDSKWPTQASIIDFPETWSFTRVMSIPSEARKNIMYSSTFVAVRNKVGGFGR